MKRIIILLAILCACASSAFATDVIISAQSVSALQFQPSNIGSDRTYNATVTNGSATVTISGTLPSNVIGKRGFQIGINGGLYVVDEIPNATTLTLTGPYPGTSSAQSITFYKYVFLRIGVNSAFRPLGSADIIQPSNIENGSWYRETAISVINTGGGNLAYFHSITLPATLDSPTNPNAKYRAGFFRADGSFIVNYSCFASFSLPATGVTSWGDICTYNSATITPTPPSAVSLTVFNATIPSCTLGQLVYYKVTGQAQHCLTPIGLTVNTTNDTITGSGGGGGGGILAINSLGTPTQNLVAASDSNVGLTINSLNDTHTFTISWVGTLTKARQYVTTAYTDQDNFWAGTQYFSGAQLRLPLAGPYNAPTVAGTKNGFIGFSTDTQTLRIGAGTNTFTVPYYGGNLTGGTTSGGIAQFSSDGVLLASPMGFDQSTNTFFGSNNAYFSKLLSLGDPLATGATGDSNTAGAAVLNGDAARATSSRNFVLRGVAGQTGDFIRVFDDSATTKFRIRSTGQPSFAGLDWTLPTSNSAGALVNNGSGSYSFTALPIPGGPANAIQRQNGANVLDGDASFTYDPLTASLNIGTASSLTAKLVLRNSTNAFLTTIHPGAPLADIDITLPISLPSSGSECLHINSSGVISRTTGADCGAGGGGTGTVTSVALTVPSWLAVTGSPITTSGTLAVAAAASQTASRVVATDVTSSAVALRQIDTTYIASGALQGNGTKLGTVSGAASAGKCLEWDASGNIVTAASNAACGSGGSTTNPVGTLVSANYTALTTDFLVSMDATSGVRTVTLYAASGNTSKYIEVVKRDTGANKVSITDGTNTYDLFAKGATIRLVSDGTNWIVQ